MVGGFWARMALAAVVGLVGLMFGRTLGISLSADAVGALIFLAATLYAYRQIAAYFDAREQADGK